MQFIPRHLKNVVSHAWILSKILFYLTHNSLQPSSVCAVLQLRSAPPFWWLLCATLNNFLLSCWKCVYGECVTMWQMVPGRQRATVTHQRGGEGVSTGCWTSAHQQGETRGHGEVPLLGQQLSRRRDSTGHSHSNRYVTSFQFFLR